MLDGGVHWAAPSRLRATLSWMVSSSLFCGEKNLKNNCQNGKSHNQSSNVSEFSKALFSHFSVHKLQRIFKLLARNRHLAMKAAIAPLYDITSVILTGA